MTAIPVCRICQKGIMYNSFTDLNRFAYHDDCYLDSINNKTMTQSEKLQKVIERAGIAKKMKINLDLDNCQYFIDSNQIEQLIFDHDFCKAYFGIKEVCMSCSKISEKGYFCECGAMGIPALGPSWQYHMQQLALTPPLERIDYLYSFIENMDKVAQ